MKYSTTLKGKIIFVVMAVLMLLGMLFMLLGAFSLDRESAEQQVTGMDLDDVPSYVEEETSAASVVEQDSWTKEDDVVVASYYTDNPVYYPEDYSSSMVKGIMEDTLGEQYEITVQETSNPPTKLWGVISPMDGFYEVVEYEDESLLNYEIVLSAILDRDNYECNFYEY